MVLIIPTSGCLALDIKNICRQIVNIEQNTTLYSMDLNKSECNCYTKSELTKHTLSSIGKPFKFIGNKDKFNLYTVPNPMDPDHPITIEPFTPIGTIILYLNNTDLVPYLVKQLVKTFNTECTKTLIHATSIMEGLDEKVEGLATEFNTNGMMYIETEHCTTSRYTLVSIPIDLEVNREFTYQHPSKKVNKSLDIGFTWNIRIIHPGKYSFYEYTKFMDLIINPTKDKYHVPRSSTSKVNKIERGDYSQHQYNGDVVDSGIINDTINYMITPFGNKDILYAVYAPNTIILDAANLFNTTNVVKQLEFPSISQFNFPQYINVNYIINRLGAIDTAISLHYQQDYAIVPFIENHYESLSTGTYKLFCEYLRNTINNSSWYLAEQYSEEKNADTWLAESNKVIPVYFLNHQNAADINECISLHLCEIIRLYKQKNIPQFLNQSTQTCLITGIPLWEYYYEIQYIATIKLTTKKSCDVILSMNISKLGMMLLFQASINSRYTPLLNKNIGNINLKDRYLDIMKLILESNKIKITDFNLLIRKTTSTRTDIISKLKDDKIRHLFHSMNKFGSTFYERNLYVVNPETNDIFVGVDRQDITDNFILTITQNTDIYVFCIN